MTDTTLDAARRCPRCEQPGAESKRRPQRNGAVRYEFECKNTRCRWYDQPGWIVDVRPDGSIPDPDRPRLKMFPEIPNLTDRVRDSIDRQLAAELEPGAEVHRRG